jgi:UDPglucose 6-dehydrogenase
LHSELDPIPERKPRRYIVGIIGGGFVGAAHAHVLKQRKHRVLVHDLDSKYRQRFPHWDLPPVCSMERIVKEANIVIVCVPTPPAFHDVATDICGYADTKIVESVLSDLANLAYPKRIIPVCLKSTAPPGFTEWMQRRHEQALHMHFSPEFLTEADPIGTLESSDRVVIGGINHNQHLVEVLKDINTQHQKFTLLCSNSEAELIKLMSNTFLATKVAFCNAFYDICKKFGATYENVRLGFVTDKRIGSSHSHVPGTDRKRGYSGSCFPKDFGNIASMAADINVDTTLTEMLYAIQKYNSAIREDHDWVDNQYREDAAGESDDNTGN